VAVELNLQADVCVLFALRRESRYFRRHYPPFATPAQAPCWARWCGKRAHPILLLETGVGAARTTAALDWALSLPQRPRRFLFAGFAGALTAKLRVGDVLWASEVVDESGQAWSTTWCCNHQPAGRLLTVSHLVTAPAAKHALGERHQALAVDMESAAFARRCHAAGVTFGCLRAISDDVVTEVSGELERLLASGVVSPWRLASALLRQPRIIAELIRLARHTRIAARRLAATIVTHVLAP
jgi:adenosylhomocysteine nucleosidase